MTDTLRLSPAKGLRHRRSSRRMTKSPTVCAIRTMEPLRKPSAIQPANALAGTTKTIITLPGLLNGHTESASDVDATLQTVVGDTSYLKNRSCRTKPAGRSVLCPHVQLINSRAIPTLYVGGLHPGRLNRRSSRSASGGVLR
jgi:hypothetical protein